MNHLVINTEEQFAAIVEALVGEPGVTPPVGAGFGASGLKVGGKIFAMLSSSGAFLVKLPKSRVDALIAAGKGERFDPGHGRLMKEWVAIAPTCMAEWLPLAREAKAFVAARD